MSSISAHFSLYCVAPFTIFQPKFHRWHGWDGIREESENSYEPAKTHRRGHRVNLVYICSPRIALDRHVQRRNSDSILFRVESSNLGQNVLDTTHSGICSRGLIAAELLILFQIKQIVLEGFLNQTKHIAYCDHLASNILCRANELG